MFQRQVAVEGSGSPIIVTTGSGQSFRYGGQPRGGFATPQDGAVNSLFTAPPYTSATETQPDGTVFQYTGGGLVLASITNPAGAIWTVNYSGGAVRSITDPLSRLITLAYSGTSGNLASIQDWAGRITSLTVNSAGNMSQIITPELCVYSLVYDSSNRPTAWINPLGDRTSYSFNASNQATSV
jgi:uncharacterized protein RhaS with RHS repeats